MSNTTCWKCDGTGRIPHANGIGSRPCPKCSTWRKKLRKEQERKKPLPNHRVAVLIEPTETPSLLLSREKSVKVEGQADGSRYEATRVGDRGMSPQLAALWLYVVYEAKKGDLIEDRWYAIEVPEREIRNLLGRSSYIQTRDLHRMAQSLTFVMWLTAIR